MSGPAELAIWTGAGLDAALKATLVLGAGGALTLALRHRSAAARHAVWAVTLLVLPALPLLARARGPEIAVDQPILLALWALGAGVAITPLVRGLLALRRLPRGQGSPVRLARSDALHTPITWGFLRPTVLMPAAADHWDPAHRDAALAHELAHVRRGDWLVHVLAHGVAALFWFHPLVWWARHRLALEAEHAADDAVLAGGVRPSTYAALLVRLAGPNPHLALGAGSHVGARVHAVLADRPRCPRRLPWATAALFLAALALPTLGSWPAWSAPAEALTCTPDLLP